MSRLRPSVALRRLLAARPWLYWLAIATVAVAIAAAVLDRVDRVDATRDAWGRTTDVLVADRALAPGDPITGDVAALPAAMVPAAAIAPPDAIGHVARHHVAPGEIVTDADVVGGGPLALAPQGWLVVPIVESPTSGAGHGDRVQIAADGLVIAADAIVVGSHDDVTLVAVPAADAALVAAATAAAAGGITVLRVP
jgi:SAF domain